MRRLFPVRASFVCATLFASLIFAVDVASPQDVTGGATAPSGREIYQRACAACHGPDGRGVPQSQLGFDTPVPDFTDCRFVTVEPDDDWMAVA
ncbi:MAG TPA: c-type cytochrome, partial [Vicinamibacterales bacterium]